MHANLHSDSYQLLQHPHDLKFTVMQYRLIPFQTLHIIDMS